MAIAKDADPEIKRAVNEKAKIRKQRQRQKDKQIRKTKESTLAEKAVNEEAKTRKQRHRQREQDLENKETKEHTVAEKAKIPQNKSQPQLSRQKENGDKQRKANNRAKNQTLDELNGMIKELKAAKRKSDDDLVEEKIKTVRYEENIKDLQTKIVENESDMKDNYVWAGEVYKNMSSECKREYRSAFTLSVPKLKRGTISRLRKQTGINFSNLIENNTQDMSDIKKKVVEFARENTMEVPDKRKAEKGI